MKPTTLSAPLASRTTFEPTAAGRSARGALAALSLVMLLASLGTSTATVALPTLVHAFEASLPQVQWVVLAYLVTVTTLIVGIGRLADLAGRRRVLVAGLALFTVASVVCGLAPSLGALVAARAVQGAGAASMMALSLAMAGDTIPRERLGRAMGLLGSMSAVGTALGPSLGGILLAGIGWRGLFFVNVPLCLVALLLAVRCLPAGRGIVPSQRDPVDVAGMLLLGASLASYSFALTGGHGNGGTIATTWLVVAGLGAVLFVIVEASTTFPLVPMPMLQRPVLAGGFAMSALVSTVVMTTLVVGPFYLSRGLGLGTAALGLVMSAGPVVSAVAGVPAGRAVDGLGVRGATIAGLAGMAAGCLAFALPPVTAGLWPYVVSLVVLTAGYALFQAANSAGVMAAAGASERGVTSGLLGLSRNLGLVTGASAMGAVFAFAAGASDIATVDPHAVARGFRVTFAVAAGLVGIALMVAVFARPSHGVPGRTLS